MIVDSDTNLVEMNDISLENVIRRCGDFNRYQLIHYIFLSFLNFSSGITGFYYVFALAEPSFRCQLPSNIWPNDNQFSSYNKTHDDLINEYNISNFKCEYINNTKCNSFVYDQSIYGRTFTEEAGYICDNSITKTWLSTAYQIGTFSVLLTGPAADKIGRRKMIQILTLGIFITTVFTQILLQFVDMSINSKFILLFINQVVSAVDSYSIAFLLVMELTSSSHTSFACSLTLIAYTIGEVFITMFAYISRDWLILKWLITIYFAISLPYLYFVPESPYWLLFEKKYEQLEFYLRKMAKQNGRSDDQWVPFYNQLIDHLSLSDNNTKQIKIKKRQYFKYIPRLFFCGFIEFVTMLLYTEISYALGEDNQTFSPYSKFTIGAIVEFIGCFIAGVLITTSLGRKYSLMIFASCTSICVLITPFIMQSYPYSTTIISKLGKLFVSCTVSVSWIYVPELFPTAMRGLANAIFVFFGSFGSILAPIVDHLLDDKHTRISFYVYSALVIIVVFIVWLFPETRDHSFDDGEQSDQIAQDEEETAKIKLFPRS